MKFYVVWAGRKKGVFASWDECKANIQGFPGAKFKSFGSRARAEAEFRGETLLPTITGKDGPQLSIAVDGACSGSIGEYRGVLLPSKVQIFRMGPWEHCTNNIMEYLAAIRGLRWIYNKGLRVPVYTDSRTALKWIKDGEQSECRTTRDVPPESDVARALKSSTEWLATRAERANLIACLTKWDTEALGEIHADFNRK